MSIENTLTDQFNLVQREEARGILRLFSRQRSVSDGFCLVVFRKEEYRGSILSDEVITEGDLKRRSERLGVRDGDVILRINLGPRPLSISEKLGTLDGYTRPYTLDLEICVSDPRNFAQRYLQWSDPVKLARIAIEGYLQRYAIRKRHDELREDMLRDYAEQALRESSNRSFGIEVVAAHKVTLFMDLTRSKELEIAQQGRLKEKEIREQSRIKQIEAQEETDIRQAGVRRDAEVKKLETQYEHEHTSLTAKFERVEDEKRKQYEMYMEAQLLEEKIKLRSVTRRDEIEEKEHQILLEARQQDFLRLEAGKDLDAKREQEMKQSEHRKVTRIYEIDEQAHTLELGTISEAHERRQKLLRAVGERSIDDIIQQIYDGRPLSEVLNEYPELRDVFQAPGRPGQQGVRHEPLRIEEATNQSRPASAASGHSHVTSTNTTAQSAPTEQEIPNQYFTQTTGTLPGMLRPQNDTINITDLGMTLRQIELSAAQHAITATHTPIAFIVSALDEHGLAHKAQLFTGDIVIEINGEEPRDIPSISRILQSYRPGSSVSLCFLRGEELKSLDL